MGWSFAIDTKHSKNDEVQRLVNWQRSDEAVWSLVDHRVVGNHLWMLVKHPESQEIHAALYLIASGYPNHGWGHKSVCHMDKYDLPLSLLSQLSPSDDEHENQWREHVKQHHKDVTEKRKNAKSISKGDMFEWNGGRLVVEQAHPDGKHFTVTYEISRNGDWWYCQQYRAKRSLLASLKRFQAVEKEPVEIKSDDLKMQAEQQALFA